jgi:cysteine desulfuration protein SufE
MAVYPEKLEQILQLFEGLPEDVRRETLVSYAEQAAACVPVENESFDLEDVRRDEECTDTVGIFLRVQDTKVFFKVTLGHQVQTLTRAMTAILCEGLNGSSLQDIIDLPQDFVPRIVGGELVRIRSQTVYYILTRMKGAARVYLRRVEHG